MSLWPEEALRERVAAGGGRVSIPGDELLGGFGIRHATPAARRNVEIWLAQAGLAVEPSLSANGLPDSVTLFERPPGAPLSVGIAEPEPAPAVEPERAPVPSPKPSERIGPSPASRAERPAGSTARRSPRAERPARRPAARRPQPAPKPQRSRREEIRRRVSTFLFVLGALMVAEGVITVTWQEPVSAFLQDRSQGTLERELDQLGSAPLAVPEDGRQELKPIRSAKRRLDRRLDLLAGALARKTGEGAAIGRLQISRIDLNAVVVNGTGKAALRKAPGHYRQTVMPGQRGSVGIAGHRTSYGAPFRNIDKLKAGDRITVTMPYGRFVYRVQGKKIVSPAQTDVFQRVSYQRLVLSACHPLYSAAQRILVFARLESRRPLGAGVVDEKTEDRMVVHVDPRKRYQRQLKKLGNRELTIGYKGKDVKEVQRLLGLPQTGNFDALTGAAVRQFQQQHKLPVDGQVGRATRRVLARRTKPPSRPPTPPNVAPQPATPEQRRAAGLPPNGPPGQQPPSPAPPGQRPPG